MARSPKTANTDGAPAGRIKRAGRGLLSYGKKRIRPHDADWSASRAGLAAGVDQIKGTFKPKKIDREEIRAGLAGRHADGGRAAFAAQMNRAGLSDGDLPAIAQAYMRNTWIFGVVAALFFGYGVYAIATGDILLARGSGIALIVTALVLAALSLRQSFSGWQIRNRRFGGIREYLRSDN